MIANLTRRPTEFRVRFPARLTDAALGPAGPLTARPKPAPVIVPEAMVPAVPAPADFWQTDAGQELAADRAMIGTVLGEMKTTVEAFRREQADRLREWQRAAIELAMTIGTRLVHDRVVSGVFPMEAKVRDMVAQLEDDAPATVYLNPADLKVLEFRLDGDPLLPGRDDPRVVADATLPRGACRVEGPEGMLLSDLTRELQEIRDELLGSLAHARS